MDDMTKYRVKKELKEHVGDLSAERIDAALDALDSTKLDEINRLERAIYERLKMNKEDLLVRTTHFGFWIGQLKSLGVTRDEAVAMLEGVWALITEVPDLLDAEEANDDDGSEAPTKPDLPDPGAAS